MVGVFTLYMTSSGVRYLKLDPIPRVKKPKRLDWLITGAMLLAGLWFIGFGISELINSNALGLVVATFGLVGLLFVRQDYRHFTDYSPMEILDVGTYRAHYWRLHCFPHPIFSSKWNIPAHKTTCFCDLVDTHFYYRTLY